MARWRDGACPTVRAAAGTSQRAGVGAARDWGPALGRFPWSGVTATL